MSDQGGAGPRSLPDLSPRDRLAKDRAHARPHRLRGEGIGAAWAEHDRALEQGVSGADDRADVARVTDPMQVDAGRAAGLGPALCPDRDRPRAGAEIRYPGQQLGLDLLSAEATARCGQ